MGSQLTGTVAARPQWLSWKDVPRDPQLVRSHGPWFLEVFSGTARLTTYVASLGVPVLPPVDIECSEMVPPAVDVLDLELWECIMQLCAFGDSLQFFFLGSETGWRSSAPPFTAGSYGVASAL